jgi:small subunit ribosomal protein S20
VPRIKSAIKRVEITERNRVRNRSWKSAIRTFRNKVEDAIKSGDAAGAQEALRQAYSVIDRAVVKGIVHRNNAARKKARLAAQLLSLVGKAG